MAIFLQKEASAEQILFSCCPKGRRAIVTAILRCVHSTSCDVHSLAHSLICSSYYNICFLRFKVSGSVRLSSYSYDWTRKILFSQKNPNYVVFLLHHKECLCDLPTQKGCKPQCLQKYYSIQRRMERSHEFTLRLYEPPVPQQ